MHAHEPEGHIASLWGLAVLLVYSLIHSAELVYYLTIMKKDLDLV